MVVDFSRVDLRERPVLVLKNTAGTPIGTLGYAIGVDADIKYNETSVIEFQIPSHVDDEPTPHYDSVIGMRIIDIDEIGQFILINPEEIGDGVKKMKRCKAYSLEYEFTFKKITLEKATYNFWNPVAPAGTLLGEILDIMPSWSVGHVDSSLIGKYRTFEVADVNLYNFIKSTAQQAYNCIFDFDTKTRTVNVIDVSSNTPTNPVYISNANLAKEIKVKENTENIITRLDVNGADGVTIRDVNPSGGNTIINLDYFMNTTNFDQELIDKYYAWKDSYSSLQTQYYNLSVSYSLQVMRKTTESAMLTELKNDLVSLENQQAVIIQSIAQNLSSQSDLDAINAQIAAKEAEITEKQAEIDLIDTNADSIFEEMKHINSLAKFESQFTEDELLLLDRYIKDDSISESSFVATTVDYYSDMNTGNAISNEAFSFSNSNITVSQNASDKNIYTIRSGEMAFSTITAEVISATAEISQSGDILMTAYLSSGTFGEQAFTKACLSVIGKVQSSPSLADVVDATSLSGVVVSGYLYFTLNTSEYAKRSVAWELYEYAEEILEKISQPSYTFSITSANFLCLDDFVLFKNSLRHGQKIYVGISEDETLSPICTGAKFSYDSWDELVLEFGDTYVSSESSFLLADLLEKSVSMGKEVDLNKYTYSAFIDSGASSEVKSFISTALDVSRNAIMSSKEQAISWGDSGIRLRKWTDETHTAYDPKQVWMNNNSILMTSTNWASAEIAIGNFYDSNLGDCWGIVAPNIVGTLLAGKNMVIESEKKDGSNAVFKVDADGCALYNSTFDIVSKNQKTQLSLDPQFGIAIGKYPLYTEDENGVRTINTDNARFWADTDGNLTFQGTLRATTGEFDGKVTAREGYIGDGADGWTIGSTYIYNGRSALTSNASGVYIGTDGISLGNGTNLIKATAAGAFTANNATITGNITATSGKIGGFTIDGNAIKYNGLSYGGSGTGVYIGPSGLQLGSNFRVSSSGDLWAASGTFAGSIYAGNIIYGGDYGYLHGNGIASSSITGGRIASSTVTGGNIASRTVTGGNVASGTISTTNTTDGINTTLGYADYAYGVVTGRNPAHFSGGNLYVNGHVIHTASLSFTSGSGNVHTISYLSW